VRYIDSSRRRASQTVATWLRQVVDQAVAVRCQTAYFTADSLGILAPILNTVPTARFVVGANPGSTVAADVEELAKALSLPRAGAGLALIRCVRPYLFHAKVLHVTRRDGSATAVVGSANLSHRGISGANVEAGIILDTAKGDDARVLAQIAARVDAWFDPGTGAITVTSLALIPKLVAAGVLAAQPPPRPQGEGEPPDPAGDGRTTFPWSRRRPIVSLPPFARGTDNPTPPIPRRTRTPRPGVPGVAPARWWKRLSDSDALRARGRTNPTGKLRLTQGEHAINAQTWFRSVLFSNLPWRRETL
jgi:hypothetical protein